MKPLAILYVPRTQPEVEIAEARCVFLRFAAEAGFAGICVPTWDSEYRIGYVPLTLWQQVKGWILSRSFAEHYEVAE
jgi:hypothetical protein